MILLIDNYDSFTYNLVQYFGEFGERILVRRNNQLSIEEIKRQKPDQIVISPGPCTPREAGISNEVIKTFSGEIPLLGVCLGHQCIGEVFGGKVVRAKNIMHGKISPIAYKPDALFRGLVNPFEATRYHSLVVARAGFPKVLKDLASSPDREIMALRHRSHPTWGVQFHPESIMTSVGRGILENFLKAARTWKKS